MHDKLWMLGIPILSHADLFCDNEYLHNNIDFKESTLNNKYHLICFNLVVEVVASGIMIVHKVHTKYNLADIIIKSLSAYISRLGYVQWFWLMVFKFDWIWLHYCLCDNSSRGVMKYCHYMGYR